MELNKVLTIIKSYPFVDIDKGSTIMRRHVPTGTLTADLLQSYSDMYGEISIVPKKMNGNSPVRLTGETIPLSPQPISPLITGMSGIETAVPQMAMMPQPSGNNDSNIYRILYEQARQELSEYKRKYDEAVEGRHRAEMERAENKTSMVGDIAQGLAGVAPLLFGGGMNGLGNATPEPTPQAAPQPAPRPMDVRLQGIIKHYNGLDDANKQKVYSLLAKLFTDISRIDTLIETI